MPTPTSTSKNTKPADRRTGKKREGIAHRLYTGQISYDFVGTRKRWYTISAILIAVALLSLLVRGLNLGIEFSGGADFQAPTRVTSATVDQVRNAVRNTNVPDMDSLSVTTIGDATVRVQTRSLDPQTEVPLVREAIAKELGISPDQVASSLIGASWGKQITQQGLIALAVFLALVMLLIWIYFRDLKMSIAAIVALLHDLVVTIGIYALVGFTFTPSTLIGLLTILGYSLYDTVVVFDKVRENVKDLRRTRMTYSAAANNAVNQVLVRSINTTVIAVLPVAALLVAGAFILGTGPLKDLGLALFVGMLAGAYSSVFIATPLLVDMKEREAGMKEHRERIARREGRRRGKEPSNRELAAAEAEVNAMQDPDTPADLRRGRDTEDDWDSYDSAEESEDQRGEELAGPLSRTRVTTVRTSTSRNREPGAPEGEGGRGRDLGESGSARRPQPRNTSRSQRKK